MHLKPMRKRAILLAVSVIVYEVADAACAAVPLGTVPFVTYFVHRPLLESEGIGHRP